MNTKKINKLIKIFNIDALKHSALIEKTIKVFNDKRFIFTNDRSKANFILKDPYKNIVPNLGSNQYSNIIHNITYLSNKKYFSQIAPIESIPKTEIFNKNLSYNQNENLLKQKFNNKDKIIIKPVADSIGRGIHLFNNIDEFLLCSKNKINLPNQLIVQKCEEPYLINNLNEIALPSKNGINFLNKKFDMRIFLFISSNRNFYISDHSFCRFSALNYDLNNTNLKATILTNTGINKHITHDTNLLILPVNKWNKYNNFKPIIETYCETIFKNLYSHSFNDYINLHKLKFISILGLDVMITANNKVKFIEINRRPDLSFLNQTQKNIKINMCYDFLNFLYQENYNNKHDKIINYRKF